MLFDQVCPIANEWVGREPRYPIKLEEYVNVRAFHLALFGDEVPLLYSQHFTTELRNENLLGFRNVRQPNLYVSTEPTTCWLDGFETIRGLPPLRLETTHPHLWLTGLDTWMYSEAPLPTKANLFPLCSAFYADANTYFYPSLMQSSFTKELKLSTELHTPVQPAPAFRQPPTQVNSSEWAAVKLQLVSQLLQEAGKLPPELGSPCSPVRAKSFLFIEHPNVTPGKNSYLEQYYQLQTIEKLKKSKNPNNALTESVFIKISKANSVYIVRQQQPVPPDVLKKPLNTLTDLQNRLEYSKKQLSSYLTVIDSSATPAIVKRPFPLRGAPKQFSTGLRLPSSVYTARLEMWLHLQNAYQSRYGYACDLLNPAYKGIQKLSVRLNYFKFFSPLKIPNKAWFWAGPDSNPLKQIPLFPWELGKACLLEYALPADRSQPTAGFWKLATASELRIHPPRRYFDDAGLMHPFVDDKTIKTSFNRNPAITSYLKKTHLKSFTYLSCVSNGTLIPVSASFETWLLKRWIHQQWYIWSLRDWLTEDTRFTDQPKDPLLSISWLKVRGFSLRFAAFVGLPLQNLFFSPLKILKCVVFCKRLNPRALEFYRTGWVIPELPLEEGLE